MAAATLVLHQCEAGIHCTADGGGTGDAVEHIFITFLAQMVNEQQGNTVLIRNTLEQREVTVVVGISVIIFCAAHLLQRVNDNQNRVRIFFEKLGELLLQTFLQNVAFGAEANTGRDLVRDAEEPVLDTAGGIFQAEVERGALLCLEIPNALSLGNGGCQPESQPGFSHLRCAGQNVQAL